MSKAANRAARRAAKTTPQPETTATAEIPATEGSVPTEAKKDRVRYAKRTWVPADIITLHRKDNPKSGKSKARYALYVDGMSVQDYVNAVVNGGLGNKTLANNDLRWDTSPDRGFISIAAKA